MYAIEIAGFEKVYKVGFLRKKEKTALSSLHLTVNQGEVFGFLGPNGAGKTTTLKLLMGLIFPTAGMAKILGMDWRDPRVKAQVGFLPEQPYFYDYLTAPELLDYLARLSGVGAAERSRRIQTMLGRVGLGEVGRLQLRKFSKGMLQRVGMAQAILHDPKIVFLDEPTSGLDPMGRREVRDIILSLKDEGKTVFFSTHILSDAEALCDRVAVLHKGELRGVGVMSELTATQHEKVEFIWRGADAMPELVKLGGEGRASADTFRALLPASQQDAAIDVLRRLRAQIISINPLRNTLEEYFMKRIEDPASSSSASEKITAEVTQ
jgi:ABC-2 type transport system ATP-binding protein